MIGIFIKNVSNVSSNFKEKIYFCYFLNLVDLVFAFLIRFEHLYDIVCYLT